MTTTHVTLGISVELPAGTKATPFRCDHCKDELLVVMPIRIDAICALARWYEDEHAECVLDAKEAEK